MKYVRQFSHYFSSLAQRRPVLVQSVGTGKIAIRYVTKLICLYGCLMYILSLNFTVTSFLRHSILYFLYSFKNYKRWHYVKLSLKVNKSMHYFKINFYNIHLIKRSVFYSFVGQFYLLSNVYSQWNNYYVLAGCI